MALRTLPEFAIGERCGTRVVGILTEIPLDKLAPLRRGFSFDRLQKCNSNGNLGVALLLEGLWRARL
jgi:hypothetical protein